MDLITAVNFINRGTAKQLQTKLFEQIVKTVLFDVVQRILQSPTNMITRSEFSDLVSVLNTDD